MSEQMPPSLDKLFARLRGYGSVPEQEIATLIGAAGQTASFPKGSDLVQQGDIPKQSCLVLEGITARYKHTKEGARLIAALQIAGDFVDLHSAFIKPMDHSVGCLTDCEVVYFPHSAIKEIIRTSPHLTEKLWHYSLVDGAISREWLIAMGRLSANQHAAHLVCEMYLRLEKVGLAQNMQFELPLTQFELADVLGLSVVHMNRTVQALRARFLLWEGHSVAIQDWEALSQFADFDPTYLGWGGRLHSELS